MDPYVPPSAPPSEPAAPEIAQALAVLRVVAGALAGSVLVYAGVAWFLTSEAAAVGFEPAGLPDPLPWVLFGLGLALLLVAPAVEARIRSAGGDQEPRQALATFRTATVAGFALREAAAVFGLVVAITTGEGIWCFALSAAALLAMAQAWPTRFRLEGSMRGAVRPS